MRPRRLPYIVLWIWRGPELGAEPRTRGHAVCHTLYYVLRLARSSGLTSEPGGLLYLAKSSTALGFYGEQGAVAIVRWPWAVARGPIEKCPQRKENNAHLALTFAGRMVMLIGSLGWAGDAARRR